MTRVVLDTSAFLAFANREPGAERVQSVLRTAFISAVNASEVVGKLVKKGFTVTEAEQYLIGFVKDIVPFDMTHAGVAASLIGLTQTHGLSLGDRSCLALAKSLNVPVLTADQVWGKVEIGVTIELIRSTQASQ